MLGCFSFASLTFVCRSPTGGFTLTTYPARSSCHRFHVRDRPCGQVLRSLCSGSVSAWFRVQFTLAPLFYRTRRRMSSKRRYFFIWALGTRKEASVGLRYLFALAGVPMTAPAPAARVPTTAARGPATVSWGPPGAFGSQNNLSAP